MTALETPVQPPQMRGSRRGARWMRRIGSLAVTLALIVLGLGAGLWLGSPASAAVGVIEVDMGDGHGFDTSTSTKLLDMSALAPGGSISGHMQVRDASGHDGTHFVDAITLMSVGVTYGEKCSLPTPVDCLAASHALANNLSFTITVSGPGSTGTSTAGLSTLTAAGIVIGSGMVDSNVLDVTVTTSLDKAVGNEVQYGSVTFNLGLGLTSSKPGSDGTTETGGSTDNAGGGGAPGNQGTPSTPEIAGENNELPPDDVINQSDNAAGGKDILVLGENKSELPNTGIPVASMLTVGGAVLLLGLALLYAARRRSTT